MKVEYFPPKVEVILQNEIPTDFYTVVSGAMEVLTHKNGICFLSAQHITEHVKMEQFGCRCGRVYPSYKILCSK